MEPEFAGAHIDVGRHPMKIRLQNNIQKPKEFHDGTVQYPTNKRAFLSIHRIGNTCQGHETSTLGTSSGHRICNTHQEQDTAIGSTKT